MEFSPPLADGSECATASSSTPTPWQCRTTLIQENRDTIPFPSTSLEHLPVNPPEEVAAPTRQRWSSPFEFLVTCVGYAVGLGNFWRFPYLCYKHGGGAFLVPYSIVLVVIGMPLFLLELGVGQKFQAGPLQAWRKIHPSLAGVGMTGVLVTFFVALYYNIIVAWTLWYLFHSFASPLPWAADQGGASTFWEESTLRCRPSLHVPNATCSWEGLDFGAQPSGAPGLFSPGLQRLRTTSAPPPPHRCTSAPPLHRRCTAAAPPLQARWCGRSSPASCSRGCSSTAACARASPPSARCAHDPRPHRTSRAPSAPPALPLHLPRPLRASQPRPLSPQPYTRGGVHGADATLTDDAQVALFTAIFPYLVLLVLLGRGVTLPGARLGLQYYLTPSWSKLASPTVWIAAASQIFYSCGVGWGTLVAFASYNDPAHNFVRRALGLGLGLV